MHVNWKSWTVDPNWNYLYFKISPSSHSISCVCYCRPFIVLMTSSTSLVGCQSFFCCPAWAVDHWSSNHWLSERQKAYRNEHNSVNGTTVKPENKGNSNFDSNWNLPIRAERWYLKTLIILFMLKHIHYCGRFNCVLQLDLWWQLLLELSNVSYTKLENSFTSSEIKIK